VVSVIASFTGTHEPAAGNTATTIGNGVVVTSPDAGKCFILTCAHVLVRNGCTPSKILVKGFDPGVVDKSASIDTLTLPARVVAELPARLLDIEPEKDLALLEINAVNHLWAVTEEVFAEQGAPFARSTICSYSPEGTLITQKRFHPTMVPGQSGSPIWMNGKIAGIANEYLFDGTAWWIWSDLIRKYLDAHQD
jgi:hypothetical protein